MSHPFEQFSDLRDGDIPSATIQIYEFINTYLNRKPDNKVNRASAASGCPKKRWYQHHGHEGETLSPRAIVNFALGDLTEHMVKYFILKGLVGPDRLYSEVDFGKEIGQFTIQNGKTIGIYAQDDLSANIGGITVTAHVDGWGKRNSDSKWELIEVKSAADFGFEEFKSEGPGDYLKQAMVNLQTGRAKELGAGEVRFVYLKKNTGHLWDRLHSFDPELAKVVEGDYKTAIQEKEPEAPYKPKEETYYKKPTGRLITQWQCNYCPFTTTCHKSAVLEFSKSGKPVYVVKK